jgi:8-oxo-dGTP pyrophosphatase MutT (NUDIX family)
VVAPAGSPAAEANAKGCRVAFAGSLAPVPTPEFVTRLRSRIGHDPLWLPTAAGAVIDEAGRVLLQRRADNGRWGMPGGIIDPGEDPADAAVREIAEETGVLAVPERLTAVRVLAPLTYPNGDQVQYLEFVFRCRPAGGQARVNDSEAVEVGWFSPDALPELAGHWRTALAQATSGAADAVFAFGGLSRAAAIAGGVPVPPQA